MEEQMKYPIKLIGGILLVLLAACGTPAQAQPVNQPTQVENTSQPPTETPMPAPTNTPVPTDTPNPNLIPGRDALSR